MDTDYQLQRLRRLISISLYKFLAKIWYRYKYYKIAPEDKEIEIEISDIIAWYRGNRYNEFTFEGEIRGGDWSKKLTPADQIVENSAKYKSVFQRYGEGMKWCDTDLFRITYQKKIEVNGETKGCKNFDELEKFYINNYDSLYKDIKHNGIVSNKDNSTEFKPIYVYIGKNGEFYYTVDGNHRLAMCMVIGIDKIPVKVWRRHSEWQKKRDQIFSGKRDLPDEIEKYIQHPDIKSELTTD